MNYNIFFLYIGKLKCVQMDEKKMCDQWINAIKNASNGFVMDPKTGKLNKMNSPYFKKKIKLVIPICQHLGINIMGEANGTHEANEANEAQEANEANETNKSSQNLSVSFSKLIIKPGQEYDIKDAIEAFVNKSEKADNDTENVKREYLMTILHMNYSETSGLSGEYKKFLKTLEKQWEKIIKDVFDINIYTSNFEVKRRSDKRNYYYDFRIKYVKDGKIINKRIDLKVDENSSEPPQFNEKQIKLIPTFTSYLKFFYDHAVNKIIIEYNKIFDDKVSKPSESDYMKAYMYNCDKKGIDYIVKIKSKTKGKTDNDKKMKKIIDEITRESITDYIMGLDINKIDLSWLIKLLNEKKYVHYFMWSRKKKEFNHTIYTDEIKDIISSIKSKNIVISTSGTYPKIIVKGKTKNIEIRLRWSNGNGVCNPSVKISWKKP